MGEVGGGSKRCGLLVYCPNRMDSTNQLPHPTPEAEELYRRWLQFLDDEFVRHSSAERRAEIVRDQLYQIYYRFLETEDEYFDYAPAPVPPQGRWRIYGLGLPETILRKVYHQNAERLLHLA